MRTLIMALAVVIGGAGIGYVQYTKHNYDECILDLMLIGNTDMILMGEYICR